LIYRQLKKILYKILLGINALLAISLLISYLAVHISPGVFALPAYFGLAYPYLLLFNILMVIVWAMLLRFEALISQVHSRYLVITSVFSTILKAKRDQVPRKE